MNLFFAADAAQQDGGIDMLSLMMIAMLVGFGAYSLYAAVRLHVSGQLFANKLLYPGNCTPEECTDPSGYVCYIFPRLFVFGLVLTLSGGVSIAAQFVPSLGLWVVRMVQLAVTIGIMIWYLLAQRKAATLFW